MKRYFKLMKYMFRICLRRLPRALVLLVFTSLIANVASGCVIVCKQFFFQAAEDVVVSGSLDGLMAAALLLGGIILLEALFGAIYNTCQQHFQDQIDRALGSDRNRKAARVDALLFEDSRFLDCVEKADKGLEGASYTFTASVRTAADILFYFGFIGAYFATVHPALAIMLVLSFLPYIYGVTVSYRLNRDRENAAAPYRRRADYYSRCVCDREYLKETRLWGGYRYFMGMFQECMDMVRNLEWKTVKKEEYKYIFVRFLSMLGYAGVIVLLVIFLIQGKVEVAAFAAIASALDSMADKLVRWIQWNVVDITWNVAVAENYMEFLRLPERTGTEQTTGRSVVFNHVGFTYPQATEPALVDINLELKENETIAVVGENGAGKSTLAKLLLGLYVPTEGSVSIDGVDTRLLSPETGSHNLSAVFQTYQRYQMTVRENVEISDSEREGTEAEVRHALVKADWHPAQEQLPDGLDTMLSREFGGTDLSGGQWQRLAIARGLYRSHQLIVLDEPTASIDPLEETAIYQKFAEISRDKTAVVITHRLGSARIADRIVVMEEGRIVQIGTHEELLSREGQYRRMYEAQAKWYV